MRCPLFASAVLFAVALSSTAQADSLLSKKPPAVDGKFQALCDSYGPGYQNVPGTDVCVHISGYVSMDVIGGNAASTGTGVTSGPRLGRH